VYFLRANSARNLTLPFGGAIEFPLVDKTSDITTAWMACFDGEIAWV
jgi:hypothetical protein